MRPFKFRFDAVRRLREVHRDELRGRLADAYEAAEKLAAERRRVEGELAGVRTELAKAAVVSNSSGAKFDVNGLIEGQRYELILKSQIEDLERKAELVEQEIERRRLAVVGAEREVKVLDSLEETGRERHRLEEQRADNKIMDEAAATVYSRAALRRKG